MRRCRTFHVRVFLLLPLLGVFPFFARLSSTFETLPKCIHNGIQWQQQWQQQRQQLTVCTTIKVKPFNSRISLRIVTTAEHQRWNEGCRISMQSKQTENKTLRKCATVHLNVSFHQETKSTTANGNDIFKSIRSVVMLNIPMLQWMCVAVMSRFF